MPKEIPEVFEEIMLELNDLIDTKLGSIVKRLQRIAMEDIEDADEDRARRGAVALIVCSILQRLNASLADVLEFNMILKGVAGKDDEENGDEE